MRCCTHSNTLVGCNKLCRTSSPGIREPRRVDAYAFIYYGCGTHGRNHINNPSPTPRVGVLSQHRVHERFKNIILRSRPFLSLHPSSSAKLFFFKHFFPSHTNFIILSMVPPVVTVANIDICVMYTVMLRL